MSNQSRSRQSANTDAQVSVTLYTLGQQRLDDALSGYCRKYTSGHEDSVKLIENATCKVVDEMREDGQGPVAVILAIKRQFAPYPGCSSIRAAIVRKCIERYYE